MCGKVKHAAYGQPFRSPLQGESLLEPNPGLKPGLKPWAGYSVMPLRGIRRVAPIPPPAPTCPPLTTRRGIARGVAAVRSRGFCPNNR